MRYLLALLLVLPSATFAADPLDNWAHWRGPLVNGSVPRGKPPLTWDDKTNVVWKVPIVGRGASTPIIWEDNIFLLTANDTGKKADQKDIPVPNPKFQKKTKPPTTYHQFIVLCLDRKTGKERWRRIAAERVPHEGHHNTHTYAAGSPMVDRDGKRLYVSFGSFGVYCYDLDGKLLWDRQLGRMETRLGWGEASTPVVHGDRVYLTWDHEGESFIIAMDAATGKTVWKVDREEPTSWATPLVVDYKGKTQVITPGTKRVRSYDAATGKIIWQTDGLTVNCIPTSIRYEDMAIVMSGYTGAKGRAIALDATDEVKADKILWKLDKGTPYVPSAVLAGDRLWFTTANVNMVTCVDVKTGKILVDQVRMPGVRQFYASPVAAAGRVYFVDRDGTTLVVEQADKFKVLATNKLGEAVDASPAIVGKQLFLRGEKHLWCIGESEK